MADPASTMFPPIFGKAQQGISNSLWLLSLTGLCFPLLALVMTIRLRVVGYKREQVCIFMVFSSHVLPARRCLSILRPWTLILIFRGGWFILNFPIVPILPAIAILMAVAVLDVSFTFGIKLPFHAHLLDY